MSIYNNSNTQSIFKSTYLCIKQHSVTGLLYFCKTTRPFEKMLKYKGSGDYWLPHLKIHGKQIDTIWYCLFTEKEELVKFALQCSEQWDIVNAKDAFGKKIWANLRFENGLDGGQPGFESLPDDIKSQRIDHLRNLRRGKKNTPEHNQAIVDANVGKKKPQAQCDAISKRRAGVGTNYRPLLIDNKVFSSRNAACNFYKVSRYIISTWIINGKAQNIKQLPLSPLQLESLSLVLLS